MALLQKLELQKAPSVASIVHEIPALSQLLDYK